LVLIIDHDVRTTRTLAQMLREDGYDVERVADGAAAVGRLARDPLPDVLVSEVTMPHVDGISVARYARSRRANISLIYVTNHPDLLAKEALSLAPPPVVLTKPIELTTLESALAQVTSERREARSITFAV
jgi:two-component system response regulator MprA